MKIRKFQEGGAMEPQQSSEQDPLMQLAEMAAQAIQNNNGQLALQVCQGLLQLIEQAAAQQENQEVEQEEMPAEEEPQNEPVFKAGGKLVRYR